MMKCSQIDVMACTVKLEGEDKDRKFNAANKEQPHESGSLPDASDSLQKPDYFPKQRHRWNTNEEVSAFLNCFESHRDWLTSDVRLRPKSGSMLLYNRKVCKYRKDGYCWKKRKDGKTTREDHMKLKVQGVECIYGCYVHSAILPTFHRRCYWLLQNPDIVLVHYLNAPFEQDSKPCVLYGLNYYLDKRQWTQEELISQLKPMFYSEDQVDMNNETEKATAQTIDAIVQQLLDRQNHKAACTADCTCHDASRRDRCPRHRALTPKIKRSSPPVAAVTAATNGGYAADMNGHQGAPIVIDVSQLRGENGVVVVNGDGSSGTQTPTAMSLKVANKLSSATATTADAREGATSNGVYSSGGHIYHLPPGDVFGSGADTYVAKQTEWSAPPMTQSHLVTNGMGELYGGAALATAGDDDFGQKVNGVADFHGADDLFELDMLHDFPDFLQSDDYHQAALAHPTLETVVGTATEVFDGGGMPDGGAASRHDVISDFSPEWSYPEGGTKVLVTGPWYSQTLPYTCLFDSISAPASLIQSGVLRCFCPAHEPGLVTLQVACDSVVISTSVVFEYKARPSALQPANHEQWLSVDEDRFKMSILERLEQMERMLANTSQKSQRAQQSAIPFNTSTLSFEDRLVSYVQRASQRPWLKPTQIQCLPRTCRGMNTLHLATALGYTRLVQTLIRWRCESPSIVLDMEVDAVTGDDMMCTPLMWACALDHKDTALLLYQWNSAALSVQNAAGLLPLDAARGHASSRLADQLESMEVARVSCNSQHMAAWKDVSSPAATPTSTRSSSITSDDALMAVASLYHDESDVSDSDAKKMASTAATWPYAKSCDTDERWRHGSRHGRLCKRQSVEGPDEIRNDSSAKQRRTPSVERKLQSGGGSVDAADKPAEAALASPLFMDVDPDDSLRGYHDYRLGRDEDQTSLLMDTDADTLSSCSPLIDVVNLSDDECENVAPPRSVADEGGGGGGGGGRAGDQRVLTLAEQIIAAIPERIKNNLHMSDVAGADDAGFTLDSRRYRGWGGSTPSSSSSPASSLQSPSPPPTAAEFRGFFNASGKMLERNFAELTLSDKEQRELYEAAKIIQCAYRQYRGRRRQQEQERAAAILIQSYYRRYKQYAFFKKMTRAAVLIQSQYRSYRQHKYRKQACHLSSDLASRCCAQSILQQQPINSNSSNINAGSSGGLYIENVLTLKRQQAAARKIQRFMRQSKNRLQQERARLAGMARRETADDML
ncbi:PREDICTED: calmodulin-binding transcription activator 1-like [Priapulus caudatus]|uniref:Calmodulin-binding transcription activator 1-like n=1 Tax=Priapulus caudatus TaxID=37621 RepID=A0ABM1DYI4_PRICU|nr:PREDICTED: calmodulin-binding transcription activator 1-like [Priapulus caudatus]